MIMNKHDFKDYLEADRISLAREKHYSLREIVLHEIIEPDYIWSFEKLLRKVEYLKNCRRNTLDRINYAVTLMQFNRLSIKLGYYIHPNNFGPGLSISHPGFILVNPEARIGSNCRIHPGVVIGTQAGPSNRAPKLGNNIYIGPGAKIFGLIEIADNIAIGANSVVNKSFTEPGISIAGVPARKISDKGTLGIENPTETTPL